MQINDTDFRTAAFLDATPAERGVWLSLRSWATCPSKPRIPEIETLDDNALRVRCGVARRQLKTSGRLWWTENGDLLMHTTEQQMPANLTNAEVTAGNVEGMLVNQPD